jgi:hypothetical protein
MLDIPVAVLEGLSADGGVGVLDEGSVEVRYFRHKKGHVQFLP